MVLVNTSVWIRFLADRSPYTAELDRLLGLDEVAGHELVYGEPLIGDRGAAESSWLPTSGCIKRPWFPSVRPMSQVPSLRLAPSSPKPPPAVANVGARRSKPT